METKLQVIEQTGSNILVEPISNRINLIFQNQLKLFKNEFSNREEMITSGPLHLTHTHYLTPFGIRIVSSYGEATLQLDESCKWKIRVISVGAENGKKLNKISETFGCDILIPELDSISSAGDRYVLTFKDGGNLSFNYPMNEN